ncbi:MAG: hypothetical protein WC729_26210 [Sphingomonas sp.]|jgi:hypothetical protein|uniref:hypothetical protein n=1 Tax=Sphingomonas sp. TaxID=28214 RepID=UPI0035658D60
MTTQVVALCILILLLAAIGGLLCCRHIAKTHGGYANIKVLIIVNYVLVQAVSGIVHLTGIGTGFRGYYDLLTGPPNTALIVTASCALGMVALCLACVQGAAPRTQAVPRAHHHPPDIHNRWLSTGEIWIICIAIALIALPALNAISILSSYVGRTGATRVISLDGGMARYSFIANWLVWVISLGALLIAGRRAALRPMMTLAVVGIAVVLIAASLSWTGGRSIVVLMVLPLVLTLLPRLKRVQWFALPLAIISLLAYVAVISQVRSDSLVRGAGVNLANWLDWEWGRFSLGGFAVDYVNKHGLLYGETFWRGITSAVMGPLNLLGFSGTNTALRSSMELSGQELAGSRELVYVVPGLSAELYLNFGLLGVTIGYYVLGRVCGLVDTQFTKARGTLARLAFSFIGAVLVLRTIPSDSGSLYIFVFYTGFPLLACAFIARQLRQKPKGAPYNPASVARQSLARRRAVLKRPEIAGDPVD